MEQVSKPLFDQAFWKQAKRAAIIFAVSFFVSACAASRANDRIGTFSKATSVAITNSERALDLVQHNIYRAEISSIVVDYDQPNFNFLDRMNKEKYKLFDDQDIAVRIEVLNGMNVYAENLTAIMGDKQFEELDSQSTALGNNLIELRNTESLTKFRGTEVHGKPIDLKVITIPGYVSNVAAIPITEFSKLSAGISEEQINFFTAGIDAIGHFLIEQKRQRNIKDIIRDMNVPVKAVCALLIADIGRPPDKDGKNGHGLRSISWRSYDRMLRTQDSFIQKNISAFDPRSKATEISILPALFLEQKTTDDILKSTQDSLTKLAEAHELLFTAFEENSRSLDQLMSQIINEGKRVKNYYDTLGKKR